MALETNYPAVKAHAGTPSNVIEEWIAENKPELLPDDQVKSVSYFNNVSTDKIQARHARNKKKEEALTKSLSSNRKVTPVVKKYHATKANIKERLLNGEYVQVVDYEHDHKRTVILRMAVEVLSLLRGAGYDVLAMVGENNTKVGWMLSKSLNKKLGVK